MRPNVLASVLSLLVMAFSCLGQVYTMQDWPFMTRLLPGQGGISCTPYTQGLLRYWKVDEGMGSNLMEQVTGYSLGGSLVGGAQLPLWSNDGPLVTPGLRNNYSIFCFDFDQYGNGGYNADYYIITNDYSVSIWAYKISSIAPRNNEMMIEGRSYAHNLFHFGIGIGYYGPSTNYAFGDIGLSGMQPALTQPYFTTPADRWVFWVMTRQGTTVRLWKDGVEVASASGVNGTQEQPCWITFGGSRASSALDGSRNWGGLVCEPRIYNRGLGSNDVYCLYHVYYSKP